MTVLRTVSKSARACQKSAKPTFANNAHTCCEHMASNPNHGKSGSRETPNHGSSGATTKSSSIGESSSSFRLTISQALSPPSKPLPEVTLDKNIPICRGEEVQQYSNIGFAVNPNDSIFKEIDKDKDGYISIAELESGLKNTGIPVSKTEVVKFFNSIDRDGDGYISLNEFKRFCTKRQNGKPPFSAFLCCCRYDRDNDHTIMTAVPRSL